MASGVDEKAGLETHTEELVETVQEREITLKEFFVTMFERLAVVLEDESHTPLWTECVVDHCRQLLVEVGLTTPSVTPINPAPSI